MFYSQVLYNMIQDNSPILHLTLIYEPIKLRRSQFQKVKRIKDASEIDQLQIDPIPFMIKLANLLGFEQVIRKLPEEDDFKYIMNDDNLMQLLKFMNQNRSGFVKFVKIEAEDAIEGEDALDCLEDL